MSQEPLVPLSNYSLEVLSGQKICNWHMNHGSCSNERCTRLHPAGWTDTPFDRKNIREFIGNSVEGSGALKNYLRDMLNAGIRSFDISQLINNHPSHRYNNLTIYKTILNSLCDELKIPITSIQYVKKSIDLSWTGLIDLNQEPKNNLIALRDAGDIYQSDREIIEARRYAAAANANFAPRPKN